MINPETLNKMIEKFVEGQLKEEKLNDFQQLLSTDSSLADEVQLSFEINEAIKEIDIMKMRSNLEKASRAEGFKDSNEGKNEDAHFGLADEMGEYINLSIEDDNVGYIGNFLQKLHLRNHTIAAKETVHEVYRTDEIILENDSELLSGEDELIFSNIQEAVAEHDIMDLRANLQSISQSISAHNWKSEEIEDYLSGGLDAESRIMIENEVLININLENDIELYREINEAIGEKDIQKLRSGLRGIIEFESSHARTVDEIEDYLSGELEESFMNSFEEELMTNSGLAVEVRLSSEINNAIGENDIMSLRESLKKIKDSRIEPENQQKLGISPPRLQRTIWYAAAASVILLLGISGIFNRHSYSAPELYSEYYHPLEGNLGATRSASRPEEVSLNQALIKMNNKDYDAALKLFSDILVNDRQNIVSNFYTGTIRQQKGQYDGAIQSFTNVISQGDNLFVEQSEWYIGLCYLSRNEREKAIRQFRKISNDNGYYQQQSQAILKKLR